MTGCRGHLPTLERVLLSLRAGDVDPVLVTTCVPEDIAVFQTLAASLDVPLVQPLGWESAIREFQALDLVVCSRLHGLIFAFLGGTPAIPITDRDKVAGVAEDAGLSRRVERLQQVTPDAVWRWAGETDQILSAMMRHRSAVRATWDRFTRVASTTLGRRVA